MRRLSLILSLATVGCAAARHLGLAEPDVAGRCFVYARRSYTFTREAAPPPRIVRLTGRVGVLQGAPVTWRVVEPAIGRRYTLWRALPLDSVRLIWSNDPMDQTRLSLAVTDSGLAGTEHLESDDVGFDELDSEPLPDRQAFLRSASCNSATQATR